MISPYWALLPIVVGGFWAALWLSKARTNLAAADDDLPVKIYDKGPITLGGEMIFGLALMIYHLPVLVPVMICLRNGRLPYRAVVAVIVLTALLYSGLLLLIATR